MLGWAVTFLVIAIIAGVLGFSGIAGTSAGIGRETENRLEPMRFTASGYSV